MGQTLMEEWGNTLQDPAEEPAPEYHRAPTQPGLGEVVSPRNTGLTAVPARVLGTLSEVAATGMPISWAKVAWGLTALAGTAVGAYHGYKRNNSVGWAIGWALLGGLFPVIVVPIAVAQGMGKKK